MDSKLIAIQFAQWLEENSWCCIYSVTLDRKGYVKTSEVTVYVNGNDAHYAHLVQNRSNTLDELWDIFNKQK